MMIGKINTQNTGINMTAMNQSIAHKVNAQSDKEQAGNRIHAIISPMGKKQSLIEQLMKQKQELTDRMNSLNIDNENGGDIQDQMKELQKQMETLDEQIAELQRQTDEDKKSDKSDNTYKKPMTKTEAQNAQLSHITELSSSIEQAEIISSVKDQVDGRVNVLKAEVKSGNGDIKGKLEDISQLNSRSAGLTSQVGEKLQESLVSRQPETIEEGSESVLGQNSDSDSSKSTNETTSE